MGQKPGRLFDVVLQFVTVFQVPLPGVRIGHVHDDRVASGVTVILPERPMRAAAHVMGGSPGTRELDLLDPQQQIDAVDAIVLSGGSAFGLDAASGVSAWLAERGRGYPVPPVRVPIVPAAIIFDLRNGGDKDWGRWPPYRDWAYEAAAKAGSEVELGAVGAGFGAATATTPGGYGMASTCPGTRLVVCAAAVVNAVGSPLVGDTRHFWAAPFEVDGEFGDRGWPRPFPADATRLRLKAGHRVAGANTTIVCVMTNANISKAEAKRVAVAAHDGFARALYPVHTPADGDVVFVLTSADVDPAPGEFDLLSLGVAAADVTCRAIARAVYEAMP